MLKADAKRQVLQLFRQWAAVEGKPIPYDNPEGGLAFYYWIQRNHSDVLSFRSAGDKWQVVHGWLLQAGLVEH